MLLKEQYAERQKLRKDKEEDVSKYWITLMKQGDTGN
jgi:hypothetical protein